MKTANYMQKIAILIQAQNWSAAEAALIHLTASQDCPAEVFYNLGKVLESNDKYEFSGQWFKRAVEARENYPNAWFELGRWQLTQKHELMHLVNAYESFEKVLGYSADDTDAQRNAARLALRLGKWRRAKELWSRFSDHEALEALYRIAAETRQPLRVLANELMSDPRNRASGLKAMTRASKGRIPLQIKSLLSNDAVSGSL